METKNKETEQKKTNLICGFSDCGGCSSEQAGRCMEISKKISAKTIQSQTCKTCINAFPVKPVNGVVNIGSWLGECHALPPNTIMMPTGQIVQGQMAINYTSKWPLVSDKPGYFCGCWAPAINK